MERKGMRVEGSAEGGTTGVRRQFPLALLVAAVGFGPVNVAGQESAAGPEPVRVFLDCQTRGCDRQEFRTEISFVDWVRESTAADVHVILTSQDAGAGRVFTFDFLGRREFDGSELRLDADVPTTFSRDERLDRLVRTFKAGLVGFVARRGLASRLDIRAMDVGAADDASQTVDDPWNLWVFSIGADVEANGEERDRSYELGGRISANRVTPAWKIDIAVDGEWADRTVELSDGTSSYASQELQFDILSVHSMGPHWSAGGELEVERSTRRNLDGSGRVAGAVEWNYHPYPEANRRQLLVQYQVGYSLVDYEQVTIFGRLSDELLDHRLAAVYQTRQPWGDVTVGANGSNYLDDFSQYSVSAGAEANVRLFRGFELDVRGSYERVRNQRYLSAEGLTDEEILVGRRELLSGYEYELEVGLSYRFGSIYNNVVNNRFPWILRRF